MTRGLKELEEELKKLKRVLSIEKYARIEHLLETVKIQAGRQYFDHGKDNVVQGLGITKERYDVLATKTLKLMVMHVKTKKIETICNEKDLTLAEKVYVGVLLGITECGIDIFDESI